MKQYARHLTTGLATLVTVSIALSSARAQETSAHDASDALPRVVCSLDKPVVHSGDSATATALADSSDPAAVTYSWTATGGQLTDANASVAHWAPPGKGGNYTLRASAKAGGTALGECSVTVLVPVDIRPSGPNRGVSSPAGPAYETEGAPLLPSGNELPNYGLYSYILIASPPEEEAVARVTALLNAYERRIAAIQDLESRFPPSKLNITYLPLRKLPDGKVTPDALIDYYDFARARLILSKLPGTSGAGPYIVSSLHPLTAASAVSGEYLVEDLSTVPASVIPFWVQQFLSQTSQQRFWEANTLNTVALRLRTAIAIAAEGLPDVRKAVASWIVLSPGH